jgi:twitching motility protein PilT
MADEVQRDVLGAPVQPGAPVKAAGAVLGFPDPLGAPGTAPAARAPAAAPPPVESKGEGFLTILDLLREVQRNEASDLHLTAGAPPHLRIDGELQPMNLPIYTPPELKGVVYSMMTEQQIKQFEVAHEFDFAYSVKSLGRYRVNVFMQRGSTACAIRAVPTNKQSIDALGLPAVTKDLIMRPRGIILVTGPTGSGKTTSLAAMIDYINEHRRCHIITVEDPIEFLHQHKQSLVNQRELGPDTSSFASAMRHVLRQDPDVILVGELRDLESMSTAITAAETGHLVLTTLHTNDAAQTIDRIINFFAPHQQSQIRLQLANSLQAIFCQTLCRRVGVGRILAYELLVATSGVRNLIRDNKIHQIQTSIETGQQHGMRTMNKSLFELVRRNLITREEARAHATNPTDFDKLFSL